MTRQPSAASALRLAQPIPDAPPMTTAIRSVLLLIQLALRRRSRTRSNLTPTGRKRNSRPVADSICDRAEACRDSIHVAAPPDAVYELVSDVTRMGEWSPICRACWWDEGAGPHVGAWFTGRNETPERTWETRCQVVAADPGRRFAWEVNNGWVYWGYSLRTRWRRHPAHRIVGVPAGRHRRLPRALRRRGRRRDREAARCRRERHPRHTRSDQEDRRNRLTDWRLPLEPHAETDRVAGCGA